VAELQTIVTCVQRADGGPAVAPCVAVDGVGSSPVTTTAWTLTSTEVERLTAPQPPFDYEMAGKLWGSGFATLFVLFWFGWGIGRIMSALR
jgi:hypothetical protein